MGSNTSKSSKISLKTMTDNKEKPDSDQVKTTQNVEYEAICDDLNLSKSEAKSLLNKFIAQNPNGELTISQFTALYSSLRYEPVENLQKISKAIFRAFDTDQNGTISFNEFLIGFTLTNKGDLRKKMEIAFKLYDIDDNGYLDHKEVSSIIAGMFDLMGADKSEMKNVIDDCIAELDTNNDDRISKGSDITQHYFC
jgi:Ca2+-binding EF-hand superfamily protein